MSESKPVLACNLTQYRVRYKQKLDRTIKKITQNKLSSEQPTIVTTAARMREQRVKGGGGEGGGGCGVNLVKRFIIAIVWSPIVRIVEGKMAT